MSDTISKKKLEKLIQRFYNDTVKSQTYQEMVEEYTTLHQKAGISDPVILEKIFDFLDTTMQSRLRQYMKQQENKKAEKARKVNDEVQ